MEKVRQRHWRSSRRGCFVGAAMTLARPTNERSSLLLKNMVLVFGVEAWKMRNSNTRGAESHDIVTVCFGW